MKHRHKHQIPLACLAIAGMVCAGAAMSGWLRGDDRTTIGIAVPHEMGTALQKEHEETETAVARPVTASGGNDLPGGQPDSPLRRDEDAIPGAERYRSQTDGASLVQAIPPSLIEAARSTQWDDHMVETLERLLLIAFDADGDGVLDDFERITAVRSMRDAMWSVPPDDALAEAVEVGAGVVSARSSDIVLNPADLRLHHDADEARRLNRTPDDGKADDALREVVIARFQLDDDGRLTADEYARFLLFYNSGAIAADLNLDGRVDEQDLRLFLDVASPIADE